MAYPPNLTDVDLQVLKIIGRGHPSRTMTATTLGVSEQVSALTWDEIQIASGMSLGDVANSIAHLGQNGVIGKGSQYPGMLARMRGASETHFFWLNDNGRKLLGSLKEPQRDRDTETAIEGKRTEEDRTISEVKEYLRNLGYDLTAFGVAVALLELESGYSAVDAASHIALTTLARDVKEAGDDISMLINFLPHARAMIDILSQYRANNLMSENQFKNDGRAILGVVMVNAQQAGWIDKVLSDPIAGQERLATSRIKYDEP